MATQKGEALHGNERIQQLMEAFPEIPRLLVVKADTIREGIKPSVATRQAGRWALPDAHWYFEYDKEETHTPEETAEGYTLSPVMCHFPNAVSLQFMFDSRSPYEVRYEERGRYRLYRDGEPIEEVFFPARPPWYDRKTSSGKPMPSVIPLRGEGWMFMAVLNYCEYAKDNRLCKYCNINASEVTKEGLGMERLMAKRDQDVYETFVAAAQESNIRSMSLSGGVILDPNKEAENYARVIRVLKRAMKDVGQELPVSVICQALEPEGAVKLKEAETASVNYNTEVWDPRLFDIICPGKAKYVGRERWLERLLQAKEVFGEGHVGSNFVVGVELAQPYGFQTEDEGAASYLEGFQWMLSHGLRANGALWRPAPGTEFAGQPSPRTEYFLRIELARYRLTAEYNMLPQRSTPPSVGTSIFSDFPHVDMPGKD